MLEEYYSATVTAPLKSIERGFFYNLCYSKRINMPVSYLKAGNDLVVCLFEACLVLEGFALLLRSPLSRLGLWVLKTSIIS